MNNLSLHYIRHNKYEPTMKILSGNIYFTDLTILLNGKMNYIIDGIPVTLNSGDAIFIKNGSLRERLEGDKADYISFNYIGMEDIKFPLHVKNVVNNEIKLIITALDEILKKPHLDNTETLNHIISGVLHIIDNGIKSRKFSSLTSKIINYINANLSSKITLNDISELTFFSPVYCDTVFKKETGKSIIEYLLNERINYAKGLLIEGAFSLNKIAELSGFTDYNYFSRVFKKKTGYTPTQYKTVTIKNLIK